MMTINNNPIIIPASLTIVASIGMGFPPPPLAFYIIASLSIVTHIIRRRFAEHARAGARAQARARIYASNHSEMLARTTTPSPTPDPTLDSVPPAFLPSSSRAIRRPSCVSPTRACIIAAAKAAPRTH